MLHSRIGTEIQEKVKKCDCVPITKFDLPQANRTIDMAKNWLIYNMTDFKDILAFYHQQMNHTNFKLIKSKSVTTED